MTVARDAELWNRRAGWPGAVDVLTHRRAHGYDPDVVDVLIEQGRAWLDELGDDPGAAVLAAEPPPVITVDTGQLDRALSAVADFTDLKSPWLRGQTGVADLAVAAARVAGLLRATGRPWPGRPWCTTSGASACPAGSGIVPVR